MNISSGLTRYTNCLETKEINQSRESIIYPGIYKILYRHDYHPAILGSSTSTANFSSLQALRSHSWSRGLKRTHVLYMRPMGRPWAGSERLGAWCSVNCSKESMLLSDHKRQRSKVKCHLSFRMIRNRSRLRLLLRAWLSKQGNHRPQFPSWPVREVQMSHSSQCSSPALGYSGLISPAVIGCLSTLPESTALFGNLWLALETVYTHIDSLCSLYELTYSWQLKECEVVQINSWASTLTWRSYCTEGTLNGQPPLMNFKKTPCVDKVLSNYGKGKNVKF